MHARPKGRPSTSEWRWHAAAKAVRHAGATPPTVPYPRPLASCKQASSTGPASLPAGHNLEGHREGACHDPAVELLQSGVIRFAGGLQGRGEGGRGC